MTEDSSTPAGGSDRALHDSIIAALANAELRASPEWVDRKLADPESVERFSRFLARHFYYERVVHFFKYSRALARVTGRRPEAVVAGELFDHLLPSVLLGSTRTASDVARLVVADQLDGKHEDIAYFEDMLRYQEAMMVVEAGPRDWSGSEEPGHPAPKGDSFAQVVEGTHVLELEYALPAVLPALLGRWEVVPEAPRKPTVLLVARSPRGRVSVATLDPSALGIIRAADRPGSLRELAERAHVDPATVAGTLGQLAEVGAVRVWTGS